MKTVGNGSPRVHKDPLVAHGDERTSVKCSRIGVKPYMKYNWLFS